MQFYRKTLLILFISLFTFTIGWNIWLYFLPHHATPWNFLYNFVYGMIYFIGGVISLFYGVQFGWNSNLGKMLVFYGLGLLAFWGGNIVWVYYTFFLLTEIPFPSYADILYLMYFPFMAIGAYFTLKIYQNLVTKSLVRDSAVIMVVFFVAIFGYFGRPNISSELPFVHNLINVAYPFGDVVILSIALIALRIGSGKIHFSLYILVFGLFLQAVSDLLFVYRNAVEIYWNGDISDTLYTCAAFFTSIGIFEVINSLLQTAKVPVVPSPRQNQVADAI